MHPHTIHAAYITHTLTEAVTYTARPYPDVIFKISAWPGEAIFRPGPQSALNCLLTVVLPGRQETVLNFSMLNEDVVFSLSNELINVQRWPIRRSEVKRVRRPVDSRTIKIPITQARLAGRPVHPELHHTG